MEQLVKYYDGNPGRITFVLKYGDYYCYALAEITNNRKPKIWPLQTAETFEMTSTRYQLKDINSASSEIKYWAGVVNQIFHGEYLDEANKQKEKLDAIKMEDIGML